MSDGLKLWMSHDPRVRAVWARREQRWRRQELAMFLMALVIAGLFLLLLPLAQCGGGANSGRSRAVIFVNSTALPLTEVGVPLSHLVPVSGACAGPYRLEVLSGALPPGIAIRERTLEGTPTESGVFPFRLRVTADGCVPPASAEATFRWAVYTSEEIAAIRDVFRHSR